MVKIQGKHLNKEKREVIEEGIHHLDSAGTISKRIGVCTSTVTREVKNNRTVKEPNRKPGFKLSTHCAHYNTCVKVGSACEKCSTKYMSCKDCKTHVCIDECASYERKMCPITDKWPYVCPDACSKRKYCGYPKCSYHASDAFDSYKERLRTSREGIDITEEELQQMNALVSPLVKQGQSFEAIWAEHECELPVCVRSAYNYQEASLLSCANIDLPKKIRYKPRKKKSDAGKERINRDNRRYDDFCALPLEDKARVVQGDSVVGFETNEHDILSLHLVSAAFQFYFLKKHGISSEVVRLFDCIEQTLGSPEAFEALFGILLVDRGTEFDDWEGMERSSLQKGARRCRVFYCDPLNSNQKSQAERNHEQLRRILPKGQSDFDALSAFDVATLTSHINSYPSAKRFNKCPFELASAIIPQELLDECGFERVDPDNVILKPYLLPHAIVTKNN